jgi:hypothetical protein
MFLTAAAGPRDKYTTPSAAASARFFFLYIHFHLTPFCLYDIPSIDEES